jgi:hypothetical protein
VRDGDAPFGPIAWVRGAERKALSGADGRGASLVGRGADVTHGSVVALRRLAEQGERRRGGSLDL